MATVQAETPDLSQLRDIQELLDRLITRRGAAARAGSLTHLRAWRQGQIGQGWQARERQQGSELEFPYATWLLVVYQSSAALPPVGSS